MARSKSTHETVFDTWATVRDNFLNVYDSCKSQAQKDQVLLNRDAARDAYYLAIAHVFDEHEIYLKKIKRELITLNKALAEDLKNIKNITATIKLISETVKTATALAGLFIK